MTATWSDGVQRRASDRGHGRGGVLGWVPVGILTSPFQWVIALLSAVLAVAVNAARLAGSSSGILPLPVLLLWGVLLLVGGAATAVVMLLPRTNRVIAAETSALILLGTGWVIYSLFYWASSDAIGPVLVGPALAVAAALRIHAIAVTGRVLRQQEAIQRDLVEGRGA